MPNLSIDVKDSEARQSLDDLEGYVESIVPVALSVTENGTYTAPTGVFGYSPVTVAVSKDFYPKAHATLDDASRVESDDMRVYPMGGTDYYPYVYLGAMPLPAQAGDDFEPCGKYFAGQIQEHTVATFLDLIDVATGESVSGYPQRVAPNWSVSIVDGGYMRIVSWTVKASGAVSVTTERYNPTYTKPLQDTKDSVAVTDGKLDAYVDASYYIDGGAGESVLLQSLTATANGTYTAPARTAYNEVTVDVPEVQLAKGLIQRELFGVINIPNSVTKIGDYAFYGAFLARSGYAKVVLPNSVTHIGNGAFQSNLFLGEIILSDSLQDIGNYAFDGDSALAEIILPNTVSKIGNYAFRGCSEMQSITMPATMPTLGGNIGGYAFQDCRKLTSIILPSGLASIESYLFDGCYKLTTVTIPDTVQSISTYAFQNCKELASITIPNSVTNIGKSAFNGCTALETITIPSTVTSIGTNAFKSCTALQTITINKAEGSITGAPWSAPNATVVWTG